MTVKENKFEDVVGLTRDLVKINSEVPFSKELEIQKYLVHFLIQLGFEYELIPLSEGKNNIIARFPSLEYSKENNLNYIMFAGHMDTVPGYDETNSEKANIKDNRIWGRGTSDMKGAIACFLIAIKKFLQLHDLHDKNNLNKIKKGICVILTVDEEMGCIGAKSLSNYKKINKDFIIDFCILGEPTYLNVGIGHKGIVWFKIKFKGIAAHASTPHYGKNAIEMASRFIAEIDKLKQTLNKDKIPKISGFTPPTINVGKIKGGNKTNVVPDECILEIDRRLIPGETIQEAKSEMMKIAKNLGLNDDCEIDLVQSGEAYILPDGADNLLYKMLQKMTKSYHSNTINKPLFLNGYTEADPYHSIFGIPVVIIGPGGQGIHGLREHIEIEQLFNASELYFNILKEFALK